MIREFKTKFTKTYNTQVGLHHFSETIKSMWRTYLSLIPKKTFTRLTVKISRIIIARKGLKKRKARIWLLYTCIWTISTELKNFMCNWPLKSANRQWAKRMPEKVHMNQRVDILNPSECLPVILYLCPKSTQPAKFIPIVRSTPNNKK